MSMPFLQFSCRRCNFLGSSVVIWGQFSYASSGNLISLNRQLGWCDHCSYLAPVEILPCAERIQVMEQQIHEAKCTLELRIAHEQHNRSWFSKLLGSSQLLAQELQELRLQCGYREDALKEERLRYSALSGRRSKPRCLSCGSNSCFPLPLNTRLLTVETT